MAIPCSNNPDEVVEKIVSAKANADKFDAFVNGGDSEVVQLGSGIATPTIRNAVRQIMADASWAKEYIADAPEGDISLNSATATSASASRILADRFADIVNVQDFGAKGDGATDDTAAIQAAIDSGPCRRVIFPRASYKITDTIHLWGNQGGQDVDLCGSRIVWAGEEGGTMIAVDKVTGDESKCRIHGGVLEGAWLAADGLVLDCYHTQAAGLKIRSCTRSGLAIGHANGGRSLQCHVSDVLVMAGADADDWSDANSAVGLAVYEPDNIIYGLNVNRCNKSVLMKTSGCLFTNCHFTAEYKESLSSLADTYAIYFDPYSSTSIYVSKFTNCYFDNHKYVLYSASSNRARFDFSNCFYFNSGRQVEENTPFEAFMLGGGGTEVSVDNFTVIPSSYCRFFDAFLGCTGIDLQFSALNRESYNNTIYSLASSARLPYLAQYYVNQNEIVNVVRTGTSVASGSYFLIGALVLPKTDDITRFTGATLRVFNRSYGSVEIFLWYSGSNFNVETKVFRQSFSYFNVAFGAVETIAVNGISHLMIPIYLHSLEGFSGASIFASLKTDGYVRPYLIGDAVCPWSSSSYIVEVGFGVSQGEGLTFTTLASIGCSISSSLVDVCTSLPGNCSGAFYLQSGTLFSSLPGDNQSFAKTLKVSKGGTGICAVECFEIGNDVTTVYATYVNPDTSTVHTWTQLG